MREIGQRITKLFLPVLVCGLLVSGCQKQDGSEFQEMAIEDTKEEQNEEKQSEEKQQEAKSKTEETIWVYVCGAVKHPGVYSFQGSVRVFEVIEKAGGITKAAAENYLNQAQVVADGEQIYIPTRKEVEENPEQPGTENSQKSEIQSQSKNGKININTASREELMTLSGIGEAKADSILSYRETNGTFQKVEDIMQIEGIKEGVFQKIKDHITVGNG